MVETKQYQVLSLLKEKYPVFRQLASEYYECVRKQELDIGTTGNTYDCYADTIKELKVEMLTYLDETKMNTR